MSKRNITYIKPEEPNFLKKLKEQIGYTEGPTVDTKREGLPVDFEDENSEIPDEKPTVVVLQAGDLTAEQAEEFQKQKEKEESEKPADLSERVIFRKPNISLKRENIREDTVNSTGSNSSKKLKKSKASSTSGKDKKPKVVLSFDDEESD